MAPTSDIGGCRSSAAELGVGVRSRPDWCPARPIMRRHGSFRVVSEQCGLDRPWGIISHSRRLTMSIKTLIAMFATIAASFAAPMIVQAAQEKPAMETAIPKPTKSGHAAVNGVNYYYAIYGTGEPLLLLHGGLGPDRDVRSQPDEARAEPAGDRRRSAGPRPHRAGQSPDQPGRHGQRHGRRAEEARLRQGRRARLFDGWRRRVPIRRSASGNGSPPGAGFHRRTRRTGSIRRCCRSRRHSAPRWRSR